jgi:predicted phage tail protein
MREKAQRERENKQGHVTLGHLFMGIALFMPAAVVVGEVRAAGGGVLRYLFGLPLALVLGGLVVLF